jgi:large subunit ribosomal protein L21
MRTRAEKTVRELERKEQELDKLHGQHESLRNLVAVRAERIRELESSVEQKKAALDEREQSLAALRAELDQAESALAAAKRRPSTPDDLTRIRGIGPAFARKLTAAGVRSFAQVAGWSDEDVERIAAAIGTQAPRIHKSGWREHAAELARAAANQSQDDLSW